MPPEPPEQPDAQRKPWWASFAPLETYVLLLWVLLACVLVSAWSETETLAGPRPLVDVARTWGRHMLSPWVLPALGLAVVLRQGGGDLSVWAMFTLGAVLAGRVVLTGCHPLWVLAAVVGVGAGTGLIHALLVALLKVPSWLLTLLTAAGATALTVQLAGGQVLVAGKAQLARWPGAGNELLLTGSFIIATIAVMMPISIGRHVRQAPRGRKSLAAALILSALLSTLGGLCWLLKDGRTPMPGHVVGDLRVAAAAVLAGAAVLTRPGRSGLVCLMVPFAMVVATIWWQLCWPTPTWPVDANLLALIAMVLAAQWGFRYALGCAGWQVKIWPVLMGVGIVSLATGATTDHPIHAVARAGLGAVLWLAGVGGVAAHWIRRRRPAPAPQEGVP